MASIERTAYPRFPRTLTLKDLQASFTPRPDETEWALRYARRPQGRLALLVLLKCFQYLRYFPALEAIPPEVVEHVSATLGVTPEQTIQYAGSQTALYRHHKAIRDLLGVQPYTDAHTRKLAGCGRGAGEGQTTGAGCRSTRTGCGFRPDAVDAREPRCPLAEQLGARIAPSRGYACVIPT